MGEPRNDFERIAEASRVAEVEKNLSKPTTGLERVLWALFLAVAVTLMLRFGRFTDGVTGPWWVFVLMGLAGAALGYFVVPWATRRRRSARARDEPLAGIALFSRPLRAHPTRPTETPPTRLPAGGQHG